jgi:predicted small metal-binding protein
MRDGPPRSFLESAASRPCAFPECGHPVLAASHAALCAGLMDHARYRHPETYAEAEAARDLARTPPPS